MYQVTNTSHFGPLSQADGMTPVAAQKQNDALPPMVSGSFSKFAAARQASIKSGPQFGNI